MRAFTLTLQFPTGGLLIGGHGQTPDRAHAAHATDRDGRPLVPATALRGALREALEALLRGAGEVACSGGDGLDPSTSQQNQAHLPCTLDNGGRCKACRLFGSQRASVEPGERAFSALILGDATSEAHAPSFSLRPGVAIARDRRSAADNRLFLQHVPDAPNLRLTAQGRLLDPSLERYLGAAVRAATHIGAGKSRGLARVAMELAFHEAAEPSAVPLPATGDVHLRVTLLAPASIGAPVVYPNLRDTREEIPGAALRGAVGFALAEVLEAPNDDAPFQQLVAEDGARFGFLYPVDDDDEGPSGPLPLTAAACKRHGRAHGIGDTLLDRLAITHARDAREAGAVERDLLTACPCGMPLRTLAGPRRLCTPVRTRTITRVALDRTSGAARDEQIFTQVLLEAGTRFEGTIRGVPPESRDRLARALALPLSLGRGRASGWGRVQIEARATPALPKLAERAQAFGDALAQRLTRAGLSAERAPRLVPLTLLSPLLPEAPEDDGEAQLTRSLEAPACFLKARRFGREGGWDQRGKGMQPALATAAGGVFVVDLGPGRGLAEVAERLEQIERQGIGQRRHQGYGQVLAFDPIFLQRTLTR